MFALIFSFRNSFRVPQYNEKDQCHNNCNIVIVQSSLQPNEESKYVVNDASTSDNNRIKNNYQYFSDSELSRMPLGEYFGFKLHDYFLFFLFMKREIWFEVVCNFVILSRSSNVWRLKHVAMKFYRLVLHHYYAAASHFSSRHADYYHYTKFRIHIWRGNKKSKSTCNLFWKNIVYKKR